MNCEFVQITVHGYFGRERDAVRTRELERHLETCAECQAELREMDWLPRQLQ